MWMLAKRPSKMLGAKFADWEGRFLEELTNLTSTETRHPTLAALMAPEHDILRDLVDALQSERVGPLLDRWFVRHIDGLEARNERQANLDAGNASQTSRQGWHIPPRTDDHSAPVPRWHMDHKTTQTTSTSASTMQARTGPGQPTYENVPLPRNGPISPASASAQGSSSHTVPSRARTPGPAGLSVHSLRWNTMAYRLPPWTIQRPLTPPPPLPGGYTYPKTTQTSSTSASTMQAWTGPGQTTYENVPLPRNGPISPASASAQGSSFHTVPPRAKTPGPERHPPPTTSMATAGPSSPPPGSQIVLPRAQTPALVPIMWRPIAGPSNPRPGKARGGYETDAPPSTTKRSWFRRDDSRP
ncbi:hypothetical protein CALVIDRAFT_329330 [Calocera viscosa TUFC12733]|uniref:Uncharacterized protein n=1 Tax=Calocera viscosa (strain TUFC12733) TaxID=1330018 RepID=A0A167HUZ0_CALVF|nr:hypothetical protein CALVIDRAFT_329330 [Calocera viscosa TUFC12733]